MIAQLGARELSPVLLLLFRSVRICPRHAPSVHGCFEAQHTRGASASMDVRPSIAARTAAASLWGQPRPKGTAESWRCTCSLRPISRAVFQPLARLPWCCLPTRDYCEGLRDSLDLVPIGAWHGNGRKAGWFSPFLLAAWDPETEAFQSVCRCMSGFTDAFYSEVGTSRGGMAHERRGRYVPYAC
jgi:hypothetical protein